MSKMKNIVKRCVPAFFILFSLVGCGENPDIEVMSRGLVKSGMSQEHADCFAEGMSKAVDGEPYNYMASLLDKGTPEKDAVNRTRRKYGADFKTPMKKARAECLK